MKNVNRDPKLMAPCAYDLFKRAEKTRRRLTIEIICDYSGYSEDTCRKYISQKYSKHFLHSDGYGGYIVNGMDKITRAEFLEWHSQGVKRSSRIIIKEMEYHYVLINDSTEMWFVLVALVIAGLWWK